MSVVQEMPLNVAHIILGCIRLMLFSNFNGNRLKSIPTPPVAVLKGFSMKMPTWMFIHYDIHVISVIIPYFNVLYAYGPCMLFGYQRSKHV